MDYSMLYKIKEAEQLKSIAELLASIPEDDRRTDLIYDIIKRLNIVARRDEKRCILYELDEILSKERMECNRLGDVESVLETPLLRKLTIWTNARISELGREDLY